MDSIKSQSTFLKKTSLKSLKKTKSLKKSPKKSLKELQTPKHTKKKKSEFFKQYSEWFRNEYISVNKKFTSTNAELVKAVNSIDLSYSSIGRVKAYRVMTYGMHLSVINIIYTTCSVINIATSDKAIYSFIYSEIMDEQQPIFSSDIVHRNIIHRFFSCSPSFLSKDGEYRSGVVNFNTLKLCKTIFSDIWEDLDAYLRNTLYEKNLRLMSDSFYPNAYIKKNSKELESSILHFDFTFGLFIIAWFKIMFKKYYNSIEIHVNDKFLKILLKDIAVDMKFMKQLIDKHGIEKITDFQVICSNYYIQDYDKTTDVRIGQKITPLNLSEVQNPFDIAYKPWKEYLVSQTISQLIINNISPGFSLTNRWLYLKNTQKGLFDNIVQSERLERSDKAKIITSLLIQAQTYTYYNPEEVKQTTKNEITTWLSRKFRNLYEKIQNPLNYAKEELVMSDTALCIFSEYVGRTFIDTLTLCRTSEHYNKYLGDPLSNKGINYFIKYMFDTCYNLYCLNVKCGIIHTDMHLSNVTIYNGEYYHIEPISKIDNPQILYSLGNNAEHQFLFPTTGYNACIIDFSRCIIHPDKINMFKDASLPRIYSITENIDKFQDIQIEHLLRIYINEFPTFESKKDELTLIFKKHFNSVFKLFTALDIYTFSQKIMMLLESQEIIKISKNGIALIEQINRIAENFLTIDVSNLLSNPTYYIEIENNPWPMLSIIIQCFSQFNAINMPIGKILDIFNFNNELKYSIDIYDMFPPYLKKYTGPIETEEAKEFEKNEKDIIDNLHKFETRKQEKMKMVDFIAKRHLEKYF